MMNSISYTCKKCQELSRKINNIHIDPFVYTMAVVELASHVAENVHLVYLYVWKRGEVLDNKIFLSWERMN